MTPPSRIAELAVPVLRYLTDDSRLVMLLLDKGLVIQDANQGFVHLLGLAAPPRGMPLAELLAAGEDTRIGQAVQAHSPAEVVLRFLDRRGKEVGIRAGLIVLEEGLLLFGEEFVLSETEVLSEMSRLNNELANTARELHRKNQALERARDRIKTLSGLLPICSFCKKIRDDKGYWKGLETYIENHSEAEFSHGLCEECIKKHYPDFAARKEGK